MGFTDFLDLVFKYGLPAVGFLWFLWATLVKNPPSFVSWREHQSLMDENERLHSLLRKLNGQADMAIDITEKVIQRQQRQRSAGTGQGHGTGHTTAKGRGQEE